MTNKAALEVCPSQDRVPALVVRVYRRVKRLLVVALLVLETGGCMESEAEKATTSEDV